MKITRFGDLQAWQHTRVRANLVYETTDWGNFAKDFKLRDQIRGAAGSVMHNCAEGFDAGFDNEFVFFLKYAGRSASEIQSEIYLALDQKYVDKATETKKIINALIAYLRRSKPPKKPS